MNFYQIHYTIADNGEFQYPAQVRNVVWKNTHYHNSEHFMLAESDQNVQADGKDVVQLTEDQARALLDRILRSYPAPPREERQLQPPQR